MFSNLNKNSSTGAVVGTNSSSRNNPTDSTAGANPKIQYLTPNCILLTYDDGDIGALLDEHFRKSLTNQGKAPARHRNLPASYWNRHCAMKHQRPSAVFNPNPNPVSNTSFGYYPDAYSSLLRSHHQSAAASFCWPSYGASHQALAAAVSGHQTQQSTSGDGASTSAAAYGLSAEATSQLLNGHMNDAVHAYNPFLSLTRPTANPSFVTPARLPAPPQYSNIRNDWTTGLSTDPHAGYQFSSLPSATTHHFSITDAHHKDALCFPPQ